MMNQLGAYSNPTGLATSFHRHLHQPFQHLLHRPCHIHDLLVRPAHHSHPLSHAHLHNVRFESPSCTPQKDKDNQEGLRTYGFDPNPQWQDDKDHYDNQKVNGLTFPKSIRQSAFTQKLDIEGCDPLSLPLAALLYQQANNFWLRKLAHGRELYIIPTGTSQLLSS